jgi:hypothetical protein
MALNINRTTTTDYANVTETTIETTNLDSVQDQEETSYTNPRWVTDWSAFNRIPKLKSAVLMKTVWTCGKGYTASDRVNVILDRISGTGKQTFLDILFNMIVTKQIGRDSFAEIIRDEESGEILNLKILDPSTIRIIYGKNGMIKRYEQLKPQPTKGMLNRIKVALGGGKNFITFQPDEIFHLSHNCYAGEMHGRSVPEALEKIILADDENFNIMRKLTRFQAVPFIMFKVKSDNATTINTFKSNIKAARESGEDLIIPDDENLLTWETVSVNPSAVLMEWRNNLNSQFYQAVGMPLILFGSAGSTESGGKIEYLGHETVFEHDQLEIEQQIKAQLGLEIKLNSPTSLLENLRADESKDQQSAIQMQPNDVQAGVGE